MDVEQRLQEGLTFHQAGDLDRAKACYVKLLVSAPEHADARHLLGLALLQSGDPAAAHREISRAIEIEPGFFQFHMSLGQVLNALGRFPGAAASFRQAAALAPEEEAPWIEWGSAAFRTGSLEDAAAAFEGGLAVNPQNGGIWASLGGIYHQTGRLGEAERACEKGLALDAKSVGARINLGLVCYDQRRFAEAERLCREALAINPDHAMARNNLGNALTAQERFQEAEESFRTAVALQPGLASAHYGLGLSLGSQGRGEAALAALEQALILNPRFAEAHNARGNLLNHLGRFDEGLAAYRQAIDLDPGLAEAYRNIALGKKFTESGDPDLLALEAGLERLPKGGPGAMNLHFGLGKALDDLGQYDRAFDHYRSGNAIQSRLRPYDPAKEEARYSAMIALMDAAFFRERAGTFDNPSDLPVFVVGLPRSGTSLVEQIIASHPAMAGAGELEMLTREIPRLLYEGGDGIQGVAEMDPETARRLATGYEARLTRDAPPDAQRIVDKMPFNFFHLGLAALLFPRARVVHCRRDPLDVGLSLYFQLFSAGSEFSYDLRHIGLFQRQYQRLMAHWREVLPLRMLEIDYEALTADPEAGAREIVDFLGLPWDEACLTPHKTRRPVRTASHWQVRQPVYTTSTARWKNYEKRLGPLKEALDQGLP